jgi:glucose/mannose transport system permease protein
VELSRRQDHIRLAAVFGCFIPFQIVLIPMATDFGQVGAGQDRYPGWFLVHVVYGIGFSTLYFRNYYAVSSPPNWCGRR